MQMRAERVSNELAEKIQHQKKLEKDVCTKTKKIN